MTPTISQEISSMPNMIRINAQVVRFRREETSELEDGLAISSQTEEVAAIIDLEGKLVPAPVWSYHLHPWDGCLNTCIERA